MFKHLRRVAVVAAASLALTAATIGLPHTASVSAQCYGAGCMGMGSGMGMSYGMGSYAPSAYLPSYPMGNYAAPSPGYSATSAYSPMVPSYSTTVTTPTYASSYADSGQYCSDATGGQVWVSTGAPTAGLTCGGSLTPSSSSSSSSGSSPA